MIAIIVLVAFIATVVIIIVAIVIFAVLILGVGTVCGEIAVHFSRGKGAPRGLYIGLELGTGSGCSSSVGLQRGFDGDRTILVIRDRECSL